MKELFTKVCAEWGKITNDSAEPLRDKGWEQLVGFRRRTRSSWGEKRKKKKRICGSWGDLQCRRQSSWDNLLGREMEMSVPLLLPVFCQGFSLAKPCRSASQGRERMERTQCGYGGGKLKLIYLRGIVLNLNYLAI